MICNTRVVFIFFFILAKIRRIHFHNYLWYTMFPFISFLLLCTMVHCTTRNDSCKMFHTKNFFISHFFVTIDGMPPTIQTTKNANILGSYICICINEVKKKHSHTQNHIHTDTNIDIVAGRITQTNIYTLRINSKTCVCVNFVYCAIVSFTCRYVLYVHLFCTFFSYFWAAVQSKWETSMVQVNMFLIILSIESGIVR